jgi:hypothetical protein
MINQLGISHSPASNLISSEIILFPAQEAGECRRAIA